jgi:hypothetical protein
LQAFALRAGRGSPAIVSRYQFPLIDKNKCIDFQVLKVNNPVHRFVLSIPTARIRGNFKKGFSMNNVILDMESNPLALSLYIRLYGKKRAYWYLRSLGASRYQALRSIFFSI